MKEKYQSSYDRRQGREPCPSSAPPWCTPPTRCQLRKAKIVESVERANKQHSTPQITTRGVKDGMFYARIGLSAQVYSTSSLPTLLSNVCFCFYMFWISIPSNTNVLLSCFVVGKVKCAFPIIKSSSSTRHLVYSCKDGGQRKVGATDFWLCTSQGIEGKRFLQWSNLRA